MWLYRYGPAALSAIAVPLALPNELAPMGNPLLGPLAIAPLLLSIYRCRSYRQAACAAMLFTAVATALSYYWLLYFREFAVWTLGGTVAGYVLFGAMLGPVLRGVAIAAGRLRPYAVACAWTVYEYLKSSGFLGFPWGLAAYPVNMITPLIQFTALTGVWGLSLLMALANAAVAEGALLPWRRQPIRAYLLVALLTAGGLGYGFVRLTTAPAAEPADGTAATIEVALIQHDLNPWDNSEYDASVRTLMRLTRQALADGELDLIVWSETALRLPPVGDYAAAFEDFPTGDPLGPFLRGLDVHLLTGAPSIVSTDPWGWSNAAFLLGLRSSWSEHYRKQQLVPFAERVPFAEVSFMRRFYRWAVGIGGGWVAGREATVFTITTRGGRHVRLSALICFEDAFPALTRRFVRAGAELLINLTNDSWSETVSAETQHLVAARFRSVETGRPLLRATNGGVTAAIDMYGRLLAGSVLPPFEAGAARVALNLPARPATTPYVRFGDYLPLALIGALLILLARPAASSGRRKRPLNSARRTAATGSDR